MMMMMIIIIIVVYYVRRLERRWSLGPYRYHFDWLIEITRSNNTDSGQCPGGGYTHTDCLSLLLISFVEEKCVRSFFGLSHTKLLKAPQVGTTYSVSFGSSSLKRGSGWATDSWSKGVGFDSRQFCFKFKWVNTLLNFSFKLQTNTHARTNCSREITASTPYKKFTRFSPRNRWTALDVIT